MVIGAGVLKTLRKTSFNLTYSSIYQRFAVFSRFGCEPALTSTIGCCTDQTTAGNQATVDHKPLLTPIILILVPVPLAVEQKG